MTQIITNNSGGGVGDLSSYQKKLVEGNGIDINQTSNEISVDTAVIATKQDLTTKQDVISDLDTVINGASKGATAIQPNDNVSELNNDAGYIDKDVNDLTNYTKTSDLPDFTTYQLKSNMVTSLNSADDDHYPTAKAVKDAITSSGGGDVTGPSSSVDGHLAVFDGATGKIIKDGGAIPTPTTVVDDLSTQSATSALSANQGYVLKGYIDAINGKIPSEASSSNQLADKNYVDDSINQVAAYYITRTAAGDAFATKAQLLATTTFYSGGTTRTPTRNDYCIVLADETHNGETTRYSYQGSSWEYQYTVNETALTSAQLNALNSGITSGKVSTYDGYATTIAGKQDKLIAGSNIQIANDGKTISATDTKYNDATQSTAGLMSASDKIKLDGIEAQAQKNTVTGVKGNAESTFRIGQVNITPANLGLENKAAASGGTDVSLVTTGDKYNWNRIVIKSASAPSSPTAGMVWYDTTNNVLKVYNGSVWKIMQELLVSGTNIKTINGNSILGSGDITVSSSTTTTCTLTSAGWSSNSQTVSVTGVTASNTVIVSPAPDDIGDYADCGVYCSAQGSGTLTFGCDTAPSGDIVVNVLIFIEPILLKSYEEITAMTVDNAVAELNTYPTEYYDKFNSEGHINISENLSDNGDTSHMWEDDGGYFVQYDNGIWDKHSSSGPS